MTYPERSAEASQMAVDMTNMIGAMPLTTKDVTGIGSLNAFAGFIDEVLAERAEHEAFRKCVDEVARYVLPDQVDPDLLLARKVVAAEYRRRGEESWAVAVEQGRLDNGSATRATLDGIKAARESGV